MVKINIANDFSDTPGGRYKSEGKYSGEEFRENILKVKYFEAKDKGEILEINLDGCFGFPSSFIDESFGGLARELKDTSIFDDVIFISNDQPSLIDFIFKCAKGEKNE